MLIAGEPSGDSLAAELVPPLNRKLVERDVQFSPRLFGAGGGKMRGAGVEVLEDMTAHSVVGLLDVLKKILTFRRIFKVLLHAAEEREPTAIIGVDFSGFNRRLAHAVKNRVRKRGLGWFQDWNPKIIQYVSPQVWASRPGRALEMQRDYDLVLALFPFEKEWYARRTPGLRVEFVGHPALDRYATVLPDLESPAPVRSVSSSPRVLLLPGSRTGELQRHLPPLFGSLEIIRRSYSNLQASMVLPNDKLVGLAKQMGLPSDVKLQVGNLPQALLDADIALASTGTVTMECALFGVPTVALYKTSWSDYSIAKRIVTVPYLSMPNLLAGEALFAEFIQNEVTPENLAHAALALLTSQDRRQELRRKLSALRQTLGGRGAVERAASAIVDLLGQAPDGPIRE